MPHVFVRKSYPVIKFYDDGWSSVDNPYGPGGYAYDGPPIPVEEPPPRGPRKLRQSILPEFDPTLDETTGYAGVPPVSALRYMGDFTAGSPVEQGDYQTSFEGTGDSELGLPKRQPDVDFNAPTIDAPHGEPAPTGWKNRPPTDADADFGYPDKGGWLYRDPNTGSHYWYKNGNKIFMDVREGVQGSWWSKPDMQNFSRAQGSAMNPTKVLALRGDPSNYGRPSMRDSDEAPERLAEMFLQHDKNIPREMLVEFPIRENVPGVRNETYLDTARRMGAPEGIHPKFGVTRWSNAPLPFNTPNSPANKPRTLDDLTEEELYRDIQDEYKQTGEPMEIAFQLLKERKSPEAMRRKKEYDTKYESSPERVKYREELNRERKRRGIYGSHDHMDVSHTQGGRLTLEGEHANRARHFKNRGTLRRVRVR